MEYKTAQEYEFQIRNYYNSTERKFTVFKLEFRKLSVSDLVILVTYAVAIVTHFVVTANFPEKRFFGLFAIAFIVAIFTTTTPFGLRFRNIHFSVIWLVLCLFFLFAGTSLSVLPLGSFILYQLIRLFFWKSYSKEFIPFQLVRAPLEFSKKAFQLTFIREVSKIEGRGGYKEDKQYMKWLVRLGFCLFMICLFGIVGIKFKWQHWKIKKQHLTSGLNYARATWFLFCCAFYLL